MTSKHTQGPWRINDSYSTMFKITTHGGSSIADVSCRSSRCWGESDINPTEEEKANASLIAAAPEMLEVLKDVQKELCFVHDEYPMDCTILVIKEVIAKAKGN